MPSIPNALRPEVSLLGDGLDITGRQVEYWGQIWTISGRNYLGDWNVERLDVRSDGQYKVTSSISPENLPESHGHFARLISNG